MVDNELFNAGKNLMIRDHLGDLFKMHMGLWTEGFDNPAEFEITSATHTQPHEIDVTATCTKAGRVQLPGHSPREVNVGDFMNIKLI